GSEGETLVAVDYDGKQQFEVPLPTTDVDHVDDMSVAKDVPWAAVAMRGGLINIVDLDSARIVAHVAGQGMRPQVAWLERDDQSPLLVVATGSELNAFNITPTDVNAGAEATIAEEPVEVESQP
ncbi:MAG TPA: hypothetical protein VGK58_23880, partial [Lacipirellulaceae bacterium]